MNHQWNKRVSVLLAACTFDAHFAVRPIPQQELDAITNKAEFLQNDGYE